jgi:hypothetical protein
VPPEPTTDPCDIDMGAALTDVLMTMAFLTAMPPEQWPSPAPERASKAWIELTGPGQYLLELVAGESFARTLSANLLGTTPDDPEAVQRSHDALKELMNISGGKLIEMFPGFPDVSYEMSVPKIEPFDTHAGWAAFAATGSVLDVEGSIVAVRLKVRKPTTPMT